MKWRIRLAAASVARRGVLVDEKPAVGKQHGLYAALETLLEDMAIENVAEAHEAALQLGCCAAADAVFVFGVILDPHADFACHLLEAEDVCVD